MAPKDHLSGTLDLLILKTLAQAGPIHGYGIVLYIQRVSDDLLRVEEGSLYPALHRIEQSGWITAEWRTSKNNRRARYYKLTPAGRGQCSTFRLRSCNHVAHQPFCFPVSRPPPGPGPARRIAHTYGDAGGRQHGRGHVGRGGAPGRTAQAGESRGPHRKHARAGHSPVAGNGVAGCALWSAPNA